MKQCSVTADVAKTGWNTGVVCAKRKQDLYLDDNRRGGSGHSI